jgi:hypothetical protein
VQDDFLVLGTDEVIDNVRGGCVATRITEPFGAYKALYNGSRVVYTAITTIGQPNLRVSAKDGT